MRTFYNIKDNRNVEDFVISNWAFLYNPAICQWFNWGKARIWKNGNVSIHHRKYGQRNVDLSVGTWITEEKKRVYKNTNHKFLPPEISSSSVRHLVFRPDPNLDIKQFGKDNGISLSMPSADMREFNKKFYRDNREYIERWKN
jgi:hypothetical protein